VLIVDGIADRHRSWRENKKWTASCAESRDYAWTFERSKLLVKAASTSQSLQNRALCDLSVMN